MKNAKPSAENGNPNIAPENAMNRGQRRPSSNESDVPDTAPTANRIPKALDQRREVQPDLVLCSQPEPFRDEHQQRQADTQDREHDVEGEGRAHRRPRQGYVVHRPYRDARGGRAPSGRSLMRIRLALS